MFYVCKLLYISLCSIDRVQSALFLKLLQHTNSSLFTTLKKIWPLSKLGVFALSCSWAIPIEVNGNHRCIHLMSKKRVES